MRQDPEPIFAILELPIYVYSFREKDPWANMLKYSITNCILQCENRLRDSSL